jgi:hypothetical protein
VHRDLIDREYARPLDVPADGPDRADVPGPLLPPVPGGVWPETPYSYLMTRRIERAKALLRRGDLSVTDVCMEVGCTSLGSFSSRFTELVGESPSAYTGPRPTLDLSAVTGVASPSSITSTEQEHRSPGQLLHHHVAFSP